MSDYHWSAAGMTDPTILPSDAIDAALTMSESAPLRVLLWLSRNRLIWDAAACAAATGLTPDECAAACRMWEERGVLIPLTPTPAPTPASDLPTGNVARPAPVKPQLREVLEYQKRHPEFGRMAEQASARLGKPIGPADTATLLYLRDSVGLSQDVILTIIAYCVSIGKANMRYIEKLTLDWVDQEISDLAAVDEHIRYLERCRIAGERVVKLLSLTQPFKPAQQILADKWLNAWQVREDMLLRAAALAAEKNKKKPEYIDGILTRWHEEGIERPDQIPAPTPARKKGAAATNPEESSLRLEGAEEELMRYTPVFRKKDEKSTKGE